MQFLGQYPVASNNIQWARHFDDEGNNELSATLAVDTSNMYLVGGTVFRADTGSTDAWVIKTGTDGKMIWNKFVGEEFNDELEFLEVNSVNEILGIGHTWSGIDSTSRESWIFKLGQTGQKIWSRKLGAIQIKSLHMSPQGSLFLGGYMKTDSLARYAVIALNEKGKRLWSRTYTGEGSINGITGLPDGRIILGGSRWRAKIDPRGYLLWESALGPADSILSCFTLPRGEILYLGIRNNQKSMMVKTGPDNKTILEKELNLTAVPQAILSILQGSQNQVLVLADQGTYKTLFWLNTSNGEVSLVNLPPEINATAIRKDHQGNLLISAHSGGILLLKNSGITF
jgi:hypothetical protein